MNDIMDQFLNENGKYEIYFNTFEELQQRIKKVRNVIRETKTDRDFDNVLMYYQQLRNMETNILLERERKEYFDSLKK